MQKYRLNGIAYMLLGCFTYSFMYCVAKYISKSIDPMTILFYRNLLTTILIIPFIFIKYTPKIVVSSFTYDNLLRGVFGFMSIYCFFKAISGMDVTKVIAISFVTPLITTLLAIILLKEKLSFNKMIALILGLISTYIILRPDVGHANKFAIFALLSCFTWSCSNILVKRLTKVQPVIFIVFYMSCVTTVISLAFIDTQNIVINNHQFILMSLIAILSTVSQIFLAKAFAKANITTLMPFDFSRLIFSAIFAYIMFGEVLHLNTSIGSLIIIFAIYIASKENQPKS